MKKIISLFIVLSLFSQVALAECDWKKGVKENVDGTFTYSAECHLRVGQLVRDEPIKDQQIAEYKKVIELKDLALSKTEQRADMWMNTTFKLQDRMNTIEDYSSRNNTVYFIIGVAFTALAVWGAGQLR